MLVITKEDNHISIYVPYISHINQHISHQFPEATHFLGEMSHVQRRLAPCAEFVEVETASFDAKEDGIFSGQEDLMEI